MTFDRDDVCGVSGANMTKKKFFKCGALRLRRSSPAAGNAYGALRLRRATRVADGSRARSVQPLSDTSVVRLPTATFSRRAGCRRQLWRCDRGAGSAQSVRNARAPRAMARRRPCRARQRNVPFSAFFKKSAVSRCALRRAMAHLSRTRRTDSAQRSRVLH